MIDKIAWIRLEEGRILSSRSHGKDVYYLPGGKREPGETDLETLVREIGEELSVAVVAGTAEPAGVFTAPAHGHPAGTVVRMTCYAAEYRGCCAPPTRSPRSSGWGMPTGTGSPRSTRSSSTTSTAPASCAEPAAAPGPTRTAGAPGQA
ncbi:hypothetical protein GCM10027615_72350 [Plantactinospora veratri]